MELSSLFFLLQPLWRTGCRVLKKLEIELPYDPGIPLLGINLEKTMINLKRHTYTPQCSLQHVLASMYAFLTGMRDSLRVKILSYSSSYLPESSPRLLTCTEMPSKWIKPFREARLQKGPLITACVQLLHCGPRSPHHNCPSRLIAVTLCWCLSSGSTVNSYPLWAPDPCFFCLRLWHWAGTEEIFVE